MMIPSIDHRCRGSIPSLRFQDGSGDYEFGDDGNGDGDDSDDDSFQESPLQRGSIPSPKVFPAAL